jgi:hypothetical protein
MMPLKEMEQLLRTLLDFDRLAKSQSAKSPSALR